MEIKKQKQTGVSSYLGGTTMNNSTYIEAVLKIQRWKQVLLKGSYIYKQLKTLNEKN